jgi:4-oxalocrotonate tautomerase
MTAVESTHTATEAIEMPFTTVKVIEGAFSDEQRAQLIENITEGMIAVYGEGMRDKTWVVIEDVKPADWAIGGKTPKLSVQQGAR